MGVRLPAPGPVGRDVVSVAARHWACPECGDRITAWAEDQGTADQACEQQVREHVSTRHAPTAHLTNAHALAAGWLAAAGHLVTLWGGPEDGAEVWLPPGELPASIGVARHPAGLEVARDPEARWLTLYGEPLHRYRCGETAGRDVVRYLYDGRPR